MQVKFVLFREGHRKDFEIPAGVTVVGRQPDCGLRVPLNNVSRTHCQVTVKDDRVVVKDLGSANGTFVNERRVTDETVLRPGDLVKVGPVQFTVQINGRPAQLVSPEELAAVVGDDADDDLLPAAAADKISLADASPGASDDDLVPLDELEEVDALEELKPDDEDDALDIGDPMDALDLLDDGDSSGARK